MLRGNFNSLILLSLLQKGRAALKVKPTRRSSSASLWGFSLEALSFSQGSPFLLTWGKHPVLGLALMRIRLKRKPKERDEKNGECRSKWVRIRVSVKIMIVLLKFLERFAVYTHVIFHGHAVWELSPSSYLIVTMLLTMCKHVRFFFAYVDER